MASMRSVSSWLQSNVLSISASFSHGLLTSSMAPLLSSFSSTLSGLSFLYYHRCPPVLLRTITATFSHLFDTDAPITALPNNTFAANLCEDSTEAREFLHCRLFVTNSLPSSLFSNSLFSDVGCDDVAQQSAPPLFLLVPFRSSPSPVLPPSRDP